MENSSENSIENSNENSIEFSFFSIENSIVFFFRCSLEKINIFL